MSSVDIQVEGAEALKSGDELKGTITTIFAVMGPEDQTEGRSGHIAFSYHANEQIARMACRGITWSEVREQLALRVINGQKKDSYFLIGNNQLPIRVNDNKDMAQAQAELREEALAKLTDPQRAALGLGKEEKKA